jgi:OOP family OmpA-OmpF porin
MRKLVITTLLLFTGAASLIAQQDAEGSKDPALFTRMPGFSIRNYEELQFDKHDFQVNPDNIESVEGHYIFVNYYVNDNVQTPAGLQIIRNYTNAIKKIGGQVVYEWEDGGTQYVTMKISKNGKVIWAQVNGANNGIYDVCIIEKEEMNQDVVADANSMANSIKESGKVAVYGIYFDTGKSTLKPESKPTLEQISKLLESDPQLRLYVVGHTDNVGGYESNMKLSMDRAMAVINALQSQFSVNVTKLKACGDGPTAPVSSNETPEGKALNRRVELVKQ